MNKMILEAVIFLKKIIPYEHNDDDKTRFDLSAALNIILIATVCYFLDAESAETVVELTKDMRIASNQ